MPRSIDQLKSFHPRNRKAWRAWLEKNHAKSSGVWLVYYKKASGKPRVTYDEAVEEALCFGWIDSLPRKLDEKRSMLLFTPRKPKSGWSKLNKQRIERLVKEGLMTDAGQEKIDCAKRDGSWNKLDAIEDLSMPDDLRKVLEANSSAYENFSAFSRSVKKGIFWWIESAKRAETRQRRISEAVKLAAQNRRAGYDKSG